MAAVDLPAVSKLTGIPYGTLRYWASRHGWRVIGLDGSGRKLYDHRTVRAAAKRWDAQRQKAA